MTKTRQSCKSPIEDVEAIVEVLTKEKNFWPGQMHTLGSDETNETSFVFFHKESNVNGYHLARICVV
jgi:hypothetical protein